MFGCNRLPRGLRLGKLGRCGATDVLSSGASALLGKRSNHDGVRDPATPGRDDSGTGHAGTGEQAPESTPASARAVGVVVIGRNEGARLRGCLEALLRLGVEALVYVDSGSRDGSAGLARSLGVDTFELDPARPFSAARARSEGTQRLLQRHPALQKIQFVDGDVVLAEGWLAAAARVLDEVPGVAAVNGRLAEQHPERSIYNRLCEIEWNQAEAGEIESFGGNVMIRVSGLREAGGWNPAVIAAEDDELAIRLRRAGGRIHRLDRLMGYHDAAITSLRQWWIRAVRCGHAYAQVSSLHGADPALHFGPQLRRTVLWGALVPAGALGLALPTLGLSLLALGAYPLRALRTGRSAHNRGIPLRDALSWGVACTVSSVPEVLGVAKFYRNRFLGKASSIIEHKEAQGDAAERD